MNPTIAQVLVKDPVLTNLVIGYTPTGFVGQRFFPLLNVMESTGAYAKFGKEAFRRYYSGRALGAHARRVNYIIDSDTFKCVERVLETPVDDRLVRNARPSTRPIEAATKMLRSNLLLEYELDVYTLLSTLTTSALGNGKWNTANSTPIADMKTAISTVQKKISIRPNILAMSRAVWDVLSEHPDLERVHYTTPLKTPELLANLLEIDSVLIAEASWNSANEGAADSMDWVWGDNVFVGFAPPTDMAAENVPSLGYTFTVGEPASVTRYRDEQATSTIVRCGWERDIKITASDAGIMIQDTL